MINYKDKDKIVEAFTKSKGKWATLYTPEALTDKIVHNAKKVGCTSVYYALLLFYSMQSDRLSMVDKALVIAALGYFIAPLDLIPDLAPFGFLDDSSVLFYALDKMGQAIDSETEDIAKERLKTWFRDSEIFELSKEDVANTLSLKNSIKASVKILKRLC